MRSAQAAVQKVNLTFSEDNDAPIIESGLIVLYPVIINSVVNGI